MVRTSSLAGAGLLLCLAVQAAEAPPPASDILASAEAAAAAQHRAVFLIFHASWCGWCKKLDRFIESAEIKPVIDKYFVVTHLTVQEQGDKKSLDNPGGDAVMDRAGGKDAGLPFFAFLDDKGETIVNSIRPGDGMPAQRNIGHPVQPYEVDWFMAMVKKAAPAMTPDEAKVLKSWLRAQKKWRRRVACNRPQPPSSQTVAGEYDDIGIDRWLN